MAKQYLFFKLCPETVNYVRSDLLLEKELFVYFKSLNRVETVFELNHFQEIRQLIEKDTDLQRHITHALPDAGIQGFLAIIENPAPLEKQCLASRVSPSHRWIPGIWHAGPAHSRWCGNRQTLG